MVNRADLARPCGTDAHDACLCPGPEAQPSSLRPLGILRELNTRQGYWINRTGMAEPPVATVVLPLPPPLPPPPPEPPAQEETFMTVV